MPLLSGFGPASFTSPEMSTDVAAGNPPTRLRPLSSSGHSGAINDVGVPSGRRGRVLAVSRTEGAGERGEVAEESPTYENAISLDEAEALAAEGEGVFIGTPSSSPGITDKPALSDRADASSGVAGGDGNPFEGCIVVERGGRDLCLMW